MIEYFILLSFLVFAVGLSGMVASRHLLIMVLSIEAAISAATILAVALFYYASGGNALALLFSLWAVASAEAMALVVFYRYMASVEPTLNVARLSKLRN